MDLIAKRKVAESWRDAVRARAGSDEAGEGCLRTFDGLVGSGMSEGEAAYAALAEAGLLWHLKSDVSPAAGRDGSD